MRRVRTGRGTGIDFSEANGTREEQWELQKRFWVSEKLADMLRSAHALAARCVSERVKVDERQNGREKMGEAAAGWKLPHRGAVLID